MKKWEKPQLIVLVRGEPGESVLQGCKTASGSGANSLDDGCYLDDIGSAARGDLGVTCGPCGGCAGRRFESGIRRN